MVDDINPYIMCITESCANNDITYAELGLACLEKTEWIEDVVECYYTSRTLKQHEVQLSEEADCNEAIRCKLVT